MKNLVVQVKVVPGQSREQAVSDMIDFAAENDILVQGKVDGVEVTVLPQSSATEVLAQIEKSLGK